jgi:glycerate 2-kinase
MAIRNRASLTAHGHAPLRAAALDIVEAGLRALDPGRAVREAVRLEGDRLHVEGRVYELGRDDRVLVAGAGKASLSVAAALEEILGPRLQGGLVVTRDDQQGELERIEVARAAHPVPDAASFEAGRRLLELAAGARANDIVLCCFTGGSSALASAAPAGVSDQEKRALHKLLLGSGANIEQINAVRKHVSRVKGGRFAEVAAPARVVNLTVSDAASGALDAITDPSVQDTTTVADAIEILHGYELWNALPETIRRHLEDPAGAESPRLDPARVQSVMLVSGASGCEAMAAAARERGFAPVVLSTRLAGEARELGSFLTQLALDCDAHARPFAAPCALVGCGGESAVTIGDGDPFGSGGPNQEAAIASALTLAPEDQVVAAFLDTDGSDGSTRFAGAIVDGTTRVRAREHALDLRMALRRHRSSGALETLDELILTGATGTNVNDLFCVLVGDA